jgi:hypothetical protein
VIEAYWRCTSGIVVSRLSGGVVAPYRVAARESGKGSISHFSPFFSDQSERSNVEGVGSIAEGFKVSEMKASGMVSVFFLDQRLILITSNSGDCKAEIF